MRRLYTASISIAFVVAVYLALRPVTNGEAVLWNDLVRPPLRTAFFAPDAWSGWIYAALAKRAIGLLRLSEFSLRIPALLSCGVYLLCLPRRPIYLIAAVLPVALGWFSTASGFGLALAFSAAAWRWRPGAPWLLGLAIAVSPIFAVPILAILVYRGLLERVAIPAIVTAFMLLILPLSHAAAPVKRAIGSREVLAVRTAVQPLRGHAAQIVVAPRLRPVIEFYKARYRQRSWSIVDDASRPEWWFSASPGSSQP